MQEQEYTLSQLRNDKLQSFELDQPIATLKSFFEQSNYSHAALTEHGIFMGCIPNYVLTPYEDTTSIGALLEEVEHFSVTEDAYWLEALETTLRAEADIVPVVDGEHHFLGYYLLEDLEVFLARTPFLSQGGSVLVLSVQKEAYSIGQLTQILERNNARVLGVLQTADYGERIEITVKLVSESLHTLLSELRRYDFSIEKALNEDLFAEQLKERSAYFEKFLNL